MVKEVSSLVRQSDRCRKEGCILSLSCYEICDFLEIPSHFGTFIQSCSSGIIDNNIIHCDKITLTGTERCLSYWSLLCGFQIARRLLGKILIDLRNTREEALGVSELKSNQDQNAETPIAAKEDTDHHFKSHGTMEGTRRSSFNSDKSMDQDDDDDKETKYRLDPK